MACWSDDNSCDNRLINGETTRYNLHLYSRKDGCLLLANGPRAKITELQSPPQFSKWAISSAQLLISHVRKGCNYTFETYSNTHAIDVDEHKFDSRFLGPIFHTLKPRTSYVTKPTCPKSSLLTPCAILYYCDLSIRVRYC